MLINKMESLGMKEPDDQRVHETISEVLDALEFARLYAHPREYVRWVS